MAKTKKKILRLGGQTAARIIRLVANSSKVHPRTAGFDGSASRYPSLHRRLLARPVHDGCARSAGECQNRSDGRPARRRRNHRRNIRGDGRPAYPRGGRGPSEKARSRRRVSAQIVSSSSRRRGFGRHDGRRTAGTGAQGGCRVSSPSQRCRVDRSYLLRSRQNGLHRSIHGAG